MKRRILIAFLIFLFPKTISAQVVINEFSTGTTSDWVEIYNLPEATESADLAEYRLRDSTATNKVNLEGLLEPGNFLTFDFGNKLNNAGDVLKLIDLSSGEEIVVSEVSYGKNGDICTPSAEQSIGRNPDGTGNFVRFFSQTKNTTNNSYEAACPTPTPDPTPTPSKTPSPTATPTPTPSPTKSPTPKPTKTPSKTTKNTPKAFVESEGEDNLSEKREVLGIQDGENTKEEEVEFEEQNSSILAVAFVVIGVGFMIAAASPLIKNWILHKRSSSEEDIMGDEEIEEAD